MLLCHATAETPLLSSHLLKMAMERKSEMMKELGEERDQLIIQSSELRKEAMLLQRANEEARQTQSLALEERSKVRREDVQELEMTLEARTQNGSGK